MTGSAQAYDSTSYKHARVDTSDCDSVGNLRVDKWDSGCYLPDDADNTFFKKDLGSAEAVKGEIYSGNAMVGKVEFHPNGESIWIYDTKNDGDTIYVAYSVNDRGISRVIAPRATSNRIDFGIKDLDLDEGAKVTVYVYDDITSNGYGANRLFVYDGRA